MNISEFKDMHAKLVERPCTCGAKSDLNELLDRRAAFIHAIQTTDDVTILEYANSIYEFSLWTLGHKLVTQEIINSTLRFNREGHVTCLLKNKHLTADKLDSIARQIKDRTHLQMIMRHPNTSLETIRFIGASTQSPKVKAESNFFVRLHNLANNI